MASLLRVAGELPRDDSDKSEERLKVGIEILGPYQHSAVHPPLRGRSRAYLPSVWAAMKRCSSLDGEVGTSVK